MLSGWSRFGGYRATDLSWRVCTLPGALYRGQRPLIAIMSSWAGLDPPYRTIVADPPWDHSDGTGTTLVGASWVGSRLPYSCMTVEEIAALPVDQLAGTGGAHLYLWTTNRYLHDAYHVAQAWGFSVSKPLVWVKEPMGFMGGPYVSSAEFVLFGRRGPLRSEESAGRQWWLWDRAGHSEKPPAFLDIVETVSPGPYVELFARQPRLGWDAWGAGHEGVLTCPTR